MIHFSFNDVLIKQVNFSRHVLFSTCPIQSTCCLKRSRISDGIHFMCYDSIPITYRAPALIPWNTFDSQSLHIGGTKPVF